MQKKVRNNQQEAGSRTTATTAIAEITAAQDKLRKENERLKQKVESMQDVLDEIADVASAPKDGSDDEDEDELVTKLNTILDLAAPGSSDDEDADDTDA